MPFFSTKTLYFLFCIYQVNITEEMTHFDVIICYIIITKKLLYRLTFELGTEQYMVCGC